MSLPIRKESNSPIMWRAYQVGLNRGNKLALAGAFNGKWTDVDFIAKCNESSSGAGSDMRARAMQSKVFMPGELQGKVRKDDQALAHKRCKLHLESNACSCGIWGYKAPARVQREYLTTPFWTDRDYGQPLVQVLCSVRLYGTILVGEFGYRASNARIETMFVPANIEMYAPRNATTLEPQYDDHGMSFFVTDQKHYRYGSFTCQRIDPEVVWRKISETYAAQVVHVADGVDMIQMLDAGCPDSVLRPITRVVTTDLPETEYLED